MLQNDKRYRSNMKIENFQSLLQKCSKYQCSLHFSSAGKSRAHNFPFYFRTVSHISHWNEDALGQDLREHLHLSSEEVSEDWLHCPVLLSLHYNRAQFHHLKTSSQQPAALCCPLTGCKQQSSNTSARPDPAATEAINSTEGLECPCHYQLDLWHPAVTVQPQLVL